MDTRQGLGGVASLRGHPIILWGHPVGVSPMRWVTGTLQRGVPTGLSPYKGHSPLQHPVRE